MPGRCPPYPLGRPLGPFKISDSFSKIKDFAVWATLCPHKGDPEDPTVAPWLPRSILEAPQGRPGASQKHPRGENSPAQRAAACQIISQRSLPATSQLLPCYQQLAC